MPLTLHLKTPAQVVVMEVEGRGVGGRGEDWRRRLFGGLGKIDVQDVMDATRLYAHWNLTWIVRLISIEINLPSFDIHCLMKIGP